MISKKFKILSTFIILSFVTVLQVRAQEDLQNLLRAAVDGSQDANTLMNAYTSPFMKGFGTALGNGWYNTAKAHKTLGFDLTVTVNAAYVPDDDLLFNANNLNLERTTALTDESPTIFGPGERPTYRFDDGNGNTIDFNGPEGLDLKDKIGIQAVPVPMAQLGIGIYKNTDLKIRWTPEIDFDDNGKFKLIGFAVMHDIKQHIPGIKLAPFDLSFLVGFTNTSLTYDLAGESLSSGSGSVSTPDGEASFDVNTWTFQGIISKKFSILTLYGGLGYNAVKSELALKGEYIVSNDFGPAGGGTQTETLNDPIGLKENESGPRITAGMRIKLAIITLHADYTVQKYNTLTVGFGFAVR